MMYQLDGLQTEERNPAKPFLGKFAEDIIRKYGIREPEEGDYARTGEEGMGIKSPGRVGNYT